MQLGDLLQKALSGIQDRFQPPSQELISPIPNIESERLMNEFWNAADLRDAQEAEDRAMAQVPTTAYRNPLWNKWKQQDPKAYEALESGTGLASGGNSLLQQLLMDISGAETSGGQNLTQLDKNSVPVVDGGRGHFMFEKPTLRDLNSNINPYSATESADLAADLLMDKQLSRWGTQSYVGKPKDWGTLDNPNNKNGKLTELYTKKELNQYLSDRHKIR